MRQATFFGEVHLIFRFGCFATALFKSLKLTKNNGCFSEQRIDSVNRCCLLKFQFQVLRGCLRFSAANSS